jgi:threonyl-tRNA synthetase
MRANNQSQNDQLYKIRHSTAHVMAQAVLELYPETKIAIGPPIDTGFYYDFDLGRDENGHLRTFAPEDLEAIEQRMRQIITGHYPFIYREVSADEARQLFQDQAYKLELIDGLEKGGMDEYGNQIGEKPVITTYKQATFEDLCRGPHVEHTGQIPADAFKLMNVAGAYWRGDEHKSMLQRIYGTAWRNKKELNEYLIMLEEAQKRDHRRLGKELDLFHIDPSVGAGLILWHPKGALVRHLTEEFCKNEHLANGYDFVVSPHVGKSNLWETSGHLDFYKENMYAPLEMDEVDYYVKPMNCPFHIMIFQSNTRSYRDLPIRYAEWGTVYRYERAGVLHGLLRVRGFTQDDAHIFCRPDQMPDEIDRTLNFCLHILRSFGFQNFKAYLSTRPEKAVGASHKWAAAIEALREALNRCGLKYEVDEGGGAFYGPKIDLKIEDAIGREWQCSTIQFDFNLPERFSLHYVNERGEYEQPYMIHRALLGSMERFMGVLIEHYGGAFPVWLSPVQSVIIPIADRHADYARQIEAKLQKAGMRSTIDARSERMQAKIRHAQLQKIPYMLVVGDKETASNMVSIRLRTGEDLGGMTVDEFVAMAQRAVTEKRVL